MLQKLKFYQILIGKAVARSVIQNTQSAQQVAVTFPPPLSSCGQCPLFMASLPVSAQVRIFLFAVHFSDLF